MTRTKQEIAAGGLRWMDYFALPTGIFSKEAGDEIAAAIELLAPIAAGTHVMAPKAPTDAMLRECQGQGVDHPILKYTTPDERGGKIPLLPVAFYRAMIAVLP